MSDHTPDHPGDVIWCEDALDDLDAPALARLHRAATTLMSLAVSWHRDAAIRRCDAAERDRIMDAIRLAEWAEHQVDRAILRRRRRDWAAARRN